MPVSTYWPRHQPTLSVGEGLVLRPFEADDIDDLVLAHQDSDMLRYVPFPRPYTRARAERFALGVSTEIWDEESGGTFAIADTETGRLVGSVGVPFMDHIDGEAQVGYWVAPWGRGRGIATAATRTISDWLFTTVHAANILLHIEEENVASVAVARAAGFTRGERELRMTNFDIPRVLREWERVAPREPRVCADPAWLTSTADTDATRQPAHR